VVEEPAPAYGLVEPSDEYCNHIELGPSWHLYGVSVVQIEPAMRPDSEPLKIAPASRIPIWLLPLVLALAAAAQETSNIPSLPTTLPSTHSLSGVVVNSVTGEPVRQALVQAGSLAGGSQLSVLTDPEGRFEFPALPESEIVIAARKPGFFNNLELHPEIFQPEIVHLSTDKSSLVLNLLPESTLSGHVATVKGEPIEDLPVRILKESIVDGRKRWEQRGQAMTDEDGQFRIANLIPGQYLLITGPNLSGARLSVAQARSARVEGFATMFYPGVPDMEAATPIVIAGGQQVPADFALKAEPIFRVAGSVLGLAPGVGASLQFASKAGDVLPVPVNLDVQTGKFEAKVPGGAYVLQLRTPDPTGQVAVSDLPLVVHADLEGVSLVQGSSITLPVNVDLRSTGPATEQLSLNRILRSAQGLSSVRLISTEKRIQTEEFQAEPNGKSAAVAVRNLMPGRYSVEIVPVPPWYVRAVTSGATDLLREDLVISSGRRPEPLEVVLRDDGAGLRGMIRVDGQPAGGDVLLFSDQTSPAHAQIAVAQNGAEFLFTGIAPGEYKVLAFDSLDGLEFRNPEVLSPYLSKALAVMLPPNEITSIKVERISRGK
jgi:uncharacterized protein (DUF2141 family)